MISVKGDFSSTETLHHGAGTLGVLKQDSTQEKCCKYFILNYSNDLTALLGCHCFRGFLIG